jgi:endoglucanase
MRPLFAFVVLALLSVGWASARTPASSQGVSVFAAKKGIALIPFVGARRRTSPSGPALVFDTNWAMCAVDFTNRLHDSGIDLVRLVINPLPLMESSPGLRQAAVNELLTCGDRLLSSKIAVIFDVHFWSPGPQETQLETLTDPKKYEQFLAGVKLVATRLAERPQNSVALEPLNEPPRCGPGSVVDWRILQPGLIAELRKLATTLPIIVTGCLGQLDDLLSLNDRAYFADERLIFSFHFYEPFAFTHQFVWGDAMVDNLKYPSRQNNFASALSDAAVKVTLATIPSAEKLLIINDIRKYLSTPYGAADIDRRFLEVARWARGHNVEPNRIFLGEFGASIGFGPQDGSPAVRDSEIRWITDVRRAAERERFLYSYWNFPRPGAYAFDQRSGFLKSEYIEALGLKTAGSSGSRR